ncbi:MAG: glucose-6-phosphate isomerase family protein [Promethearchaeota archaeon]
MLECFHTKGNRHVNGEFEVYRVVMGEIAFVQTSPELQDSSVILGKEGDMFNVIPRYFHRAVNLSSKKFLVTSDVRPMDTQTSYSPVDEKGYPINIVRDAKNNLFLRRSDGQTVPLKEELLEVQRVVYHSQIKIKNSLIKKIIEKAQKNQLQLGKPYEDTGYIVSNIRKVSDMKNFYINSDEAAKINDIAYITLVGRLKEINIINGLTIILPGAVSL